MISIGGILGQVLHYLDLAGRAVAAHSSVVHIW